MSSWPRNVWIRRSIPLILLAAAIAAYSIIPGEIAVRREAAEEKHALLTAQLWVASSLYRQDMERYKMFRDSLLIAHNVSPSDMKGYLDEFELSLPDPAKFASRVKRIVDSLISVEDSLRTVRMQEVDSTDSTTATFTP